jgi:hypothetical protein
MMVLFVMLNFTSSGGLFRPELQNGFFGTLHAFWNGAGFVEGARTLLYFGDDGLARDVWTLVAWLLVGLAVTAIAALYERPRRARHAAGPREIPAEAVPTAAVTRTGPAAEEEAREEVEETVGV